MATSEMTKEDRKLFDAVVTLAKHCASRKDCDRCLFQANGCLFKDVAPSEFAVPAKFVNGYQAE